VLPGYRVPEATFTGDSRYRACFEHCLPHTFLVNERGERFCDDSFHSRIVAAALAENERGLPANLPIFMIWDADHHDLYGLGATLPGEDYPAGLVCSAPDLTGLAAQLELPAAQLEATAERFNAAAVDGVDVDFGRGTNLSVRRFRGDGNQHPNPCVGTVARAPFFGMRIHLLSTGIAAMAVCAGSRGRVLDHDGDPIPGLWAVGECAGRAAAGVGYNSGYSLSRAMAYGFLAANDIATSRVLPAA
jgi:3-oxosteroid 1-dehydrogenase